MTGNTSTIQIEVRVDGKGGIKVLRQIGTESEKIGKKGQKGFRNMGQSVGAFNKQMNLTHGLVAKLGAASGFQHLIDISQRTADAMEDNFSSFYRDFFRGELDSAEDYFRKFCYSLTDSFSEMMGQMTKEALFGGGSSGSSGLFGSLLSTGISSWFGGGAGGMGTGGGAMEIGGAADWSPSGAWSYDVLHKGGTVGVDAAPTRMMPASLLAHAPRLHRGLAEDEFPAILQKGETVIPQGQASSQVKNLTISVPVTIEGQGDDRLASKLSYEMEETARRVMREEMR